MVTNRRDVMFLSLVCLVGLLASAGAHPACHFPAIFNFRDSNSDTGGLSAVFGQAPSPYGETYFRTPSGRYCDGRLVVDFIGTHMHAGHLAIAFTT